MMKRIGLIAGNGKFPLLFARAARDRDVSIIACAIQGETDPAIEKLVDKLYWISLGELGRLAGIFREEDIKEAVMAGQVRLARLLNEKIEFDETSRRILKDVPDFRGDNLMERVEAWLAETGISLIPSSSFLEHLVAQEGTLTRLGPQMGQIADIELGKVIARKLADQKIGQTVVVKNGVVVALEAVEGTNEVIKRGVALGGKGVVVVKVARSGHDMKFDLPVIGLKTMEVLKRGVSVLAIEAGKTIIFDKEELISQADKLGISIVAI